MKILILGRNGQVAGELTKQCPSLGETLALGQVDADFKKPTDVLKAIEKFRPTHIVNAAAYTAVDMAEKEESIAQQVNGDTVGAIANLAQDMNVPLIHYSTDYVFDGAKSAPYVETDTPNPINVYGRSKLLGEQLIQEAGGSHVIMRVSWVYGTLGKNFYNTMLRLGKEKPELKIVSDQIGAPTRAYDIARATVAVLSDRELKAKSGIYHLSPKGETSWFDFAKEILATEVRLHPEFAGKLAKVLPIPTSEYPSPARRPLNSRMSSEKFSQTFNFSLASWDHSLHQMMQEFKSVGAQE